MAEPVGNPATHHRPHFEPLRWIGTYKLLKGALSLVAGLLVLRLMHRNLPAVATGWMTHVGIDPNSRFGVLILHRVLEINTKRLEWLAAGLFAYVPLAIVEGVGLIFRRVWAEWVTVISTAALIPVEIHHIVHHPRPPGILILALNIIVVNYLIWRIYRDRQRH